MKNIGLHLIQNPSGTFGFVGRVPCQLGFVTKNGNMVSAEEVESQLMLPASYRTIKSRSFVSEDEAWKEAARLGFCMTEKDTKNET
jgi:ABC-type lipoprotein export system ATPase subunit